MSINKYNINTHIFKTSKETCVRKINKIFGNILKTFLKSFEFKPHKSMLLDITCVSNSTDHKTSKKHVLEKLTRHLEVS